jgi:hypothetical protein
MALHSQLCLLFSLLKRLNKGIMLLFKILSQGIFVSALLLSFPRNKLNMFFPSKSHNRIFMSAFLSAQKDSIQARSTLPKHKNPLKSFHVSASFPSFPHNKLNMFCLSKNRTHILTCLRFSLPERSQYKLDILCLYTKRESGTTDVSASLPSLVQNKLNIFCLSKILADFVACLLFSLPTLPIYQKEYHHYYMSLRLCGSFSCSKEAFDVSMCGDLGPAVR